MAETVRSRFPQLRSYRFFRICIVSVFALLIAGDASRAQNARFDTGRLEIVTGEKRFAFDIEIARTPSQQQQGLMYRRKMPANAGMLFLYGSPSRVSMWMKNTYIPLDMLFIDANGKIADIAARTVPHSTEVITSKVPVIAVLELNGGTTSRLKIRIGDRVIHPYFKAAKP